jgi:hypothetical protein
MTRRVSGLPSWREIADPRKDIADGSLDEPLFVAVLEDGATSSGEPDPTSPMPRSSPGWVNSPIALAGPRLARTWPTPTETCAARRPPSWPS